MFHYPLDRIAAPALVIHGAADKAVPFSHAERLAAALPHGELLAIPNGNLIQARVRAFLGKHASCQPY